MKVWFCNSNHRHQSLPRLILGALYGDILKQMLKNKDSNLIVIKRLFSNTVALTRWRVIVISPSRERNVQPMNMQTIPVRDFDIFVRSGKTEEVSPPGGLDTRQDI